MRTQDNGKTGYEKRPSRAPAARTGPSTEWQGPGAPSAQGLRAFQGAAGNAAAVQMLRRSGHAWAQEQHQHGAGCGHQQNEQPQVQRVMAGPAPVQRTATADSDSAAPTASEPTLQRATGQGSMEMDLDPPDFSDAEEIDDGGYDSEAFEEDYQQFMATRDQLPRDTTTNPQPAAGFGKSTYGIHPSKVKTLRQDRKKGRPAPELRYRQDNHLLYRWDKRAPGEILGSGFAPWNEKLPPSLRHYQKLLQKTGFVSTTRSEGGYVPEWARQTDGSGYRYVINAPGGIDLVDTLGTTSFVQQQEVIFWKGIRPEFILRVEKCNAKGELIEVIHNNGGAPQQPQQGDAMDID
ncbi:hypothetical protein [Streptomyces sp. NPDC050485]|uniref:scabin-related ADP-ribosyltransferase n=1 Tax=Streptomyces sp. NPDC050485 TaxID=3365617 RepID=UPI00379F76BB